MNKYIFQHEMKVRDYECDVQGIVNNANYQHYYENTRHEFLLANDVSFWELHKQSIDAVVARIRIEYKNSLCPQDEFISALNVKKDGVKYIFHQAIFRKKDNVLCSKAKVTVVVKQEGKLISGHEEFDRLLP